MNKNSNHIDEWKTDIDPIEIIDAVDILCQAIINNDTQVFLNIYYVIKSCHILTKKTAII